MCASVQPLLSGLCCLGGGWLCFRGVSAVVIQPEKQQLREVRCAGRLCRQDGIMAFSHFGERYLFKIFSKPLSFRAACNEQ